MKLKLLCVCVCLSVISRGVAQFSAVPVKIDNELMSTMDDAENLFRYGFCASNIEDGVGSSSSTAISAAIGMPKEKYAIFAGMEITKIRIGLAANCTNVSIWIRNSLTGTKLVTKSLGAVSQGWTEITLDTPYIIPEGKDVYIGYTATGIYHIGFSGSEAYDANWLYDSSWKNYFGSFGSSLCIEALINTKEASVMDGSMISMNDSYAETNTPFTISGSVQNISSVEFTSMKVAYTIGEQSPVEHLITTSIAPMQTASFEIQPEPIAEPGTYPISITILEINGQPDTYTPNNTLNSILEVYKITFPKKIVIEEGTGTWCGWCTRGVVGMAMMKEKYPETFIGIAVHNGDAMTVTAYDRAMTNAYYSSFPSMVVNRKKSLIGDPYFDAEDFYQKEMAIPSPIGIKLNGNFTDEKKETISLKTITTFGYSGNANFKLAYVLIENGVTGTGNNYAQQNYYAGGAYGKMGGFETKPSPITNMEFNDVARGIYSGFTGITNSIPLFVTEMEPNEHSYTLTLPSTIKNKNNLEVAVLLLNSAGEIVNADKIEISDYVGIPAVTAVTVFATIRDNILYIDSEVPVQSITVYNVSGQKVFSLNSIAGNAVPVNQLVPGVYLVKIKTVSGENTVKVVK
jgi:hypothetical protein